MRRQRVKERADWRQTAEAHGFAFHTLGGHPYWDESACYAFTLREIETGLEAPAAELEQMCLDIVDTAVGRESMMVALAIPQAHWDYVATSWRRRERNLYGRMDLGFDGHGPAKLYEYNADTPTSLYETGVFQWVWLEQTMERGLIASGCDQFNSVHERLVDAFGRLGISGPLHLASLRDNVEDRGTIEYLAECARQGGLKAELMAIEDIGVRADGHFCDLNDHAIGWLFKLYPWEWLLREAFARHIPDSRCRFIEPVWKSVLSNKGLLALLWQRFPGHPNLLPAFFADDPRAGELSGAYVRKPLYSREGANVEIRDGAAGSVATSAAGPYGAEGHIVQAFHPLPRFDDEHPVCGVWLVASEPAGLGIRADAGLVTGNGSRFVPHVILD
jgi:glutathionylspermidine synthase